MCKSQSSIRVELNTPIRIVVVEYESEIDPG